MILSFHIVLIWLLQATICLSLERQQAHDPLVLVTKTGKRRPLMRREVAKRPRANHTIKASVLEKSKDQNQSRAQSWFKMGSRRPLMRRMAKRTSANSTAGASSHEDKAQSWWKPYKSNVRSKLDDVQRFMMAGRRRKEAASKPKDTRMRISIYNDKYCSDEDEESKVAMFQVNSGFDNSSCRQATFLYRNNATSDGNLSLWKSVPVLLDFVCKGEGDKRTALIASYHRPKDGLNECMYKNELDSYKLTLDYAVKFSDGKCVKSKLTSSKEVQYVKVVNLDKGLYEHASCFKREGLNFGLLVVIIAIPIVLLFICSGGYGAALRFGGFKTQDAPPEDAELGPETGHSSAAQPSHTPQEPADNNGQAMGHSEQPTAQSQPLAQSQATSQQDQARLSTGSAGSRGSPSNATPGGDSPGRRKSNRRSLRGRQSVSGGIHFDGEPPPPGSDGEPAYVPPDSWL